MGNFSKTSVTSVTRYRSVTDGVIWGVTRKIPPPVGGPRYLVAAVLKRMIADAQQGDAAAAWAAWAGVGLHWATSLGIDDAAWHARLRVVGIEKPAQEPAEPVDRSG